MMNFTDKVYPVPDQYLSMVKQYGDLAKEYTEKSNEKIKKFKDEMAELENNMLEQQKQLWIKLATAVGIDAAESWGNEFYGLQTLFVDHGFAAFIHREVEKPEEMQDDIKMPEVHPSMLN